MARRRWKCFAVYETRGYQRKRSRSHRREYATGGSDSSITIFDTGNRNRDDWEIRIGLMLKVNRNLSHFTLEAMRRNINKRLTKQVGRANFHLKVRRHPHMIYREHSMMSFAGADRLSSGMRNAFGRPVGKCAPTKAGTIILEIDGMFKHFNFIKKSIFNASHKIGAGSQLVLIKTSKPEYDIKINLPRLDSYV
jgi:large subunit ribosomal protein L10e